MSTTVDVQRIAQVIVRHHVAFATVRDEVTGGFVSRCMCGYVSEKPGDYGQTASGQTEHVAAEIAAALAGTP